MDEPTTALDVVVQREILDEIRALQARLGFAVLFITHELSLLLDLADRIAVMYSGSVVEEAPAAGVIAGAAHPYTIGLLNSFPALDGPVRTRPFGGVLPPRGPGRGAKPPGARPGEMNAMTDTASISTVALTASGLTKTYASRWAPRRRAGTAAVAGVDLELRRGTITGLVGQSGSGKSTIAKLLALLERRDSGTVLLDGTPAGPVPTNAYAAAAGAPLRPDPRRGPVAVRHAARAGAPAPGQ